MATRDTRRMVGSEIERVRQLQEEQTIRDILGMSPNARISVSRDPNSMHETITVQEPGGTIKKYPVDVVEAIRKQRDTEAYMAKLQSQGLMSNSTVTSYGTSTGGDLWGTSTVGYPSIGINPMYTSPGLAPQPMPQFMPPQYIQPMMSPAAVDAILKMNPSISQKAAPIERVEEDLNPLRDRYPGWQQWDEYLVGYKFIRANYHSLQDDTFKYVAGEWAVKRGTAGLFMEPEVDKCKSYYTSNSKGVGRLVKLLFLPEDFLTNNSVEKAFVMAITDVLTQYPETIVWPKMYTPEDARVAIAVKAVEQGKPMANPTNRDDYAAEMFAALTRATKKSPPFMDRVWK